MNTNKGDNVEEIVESEMDVQPTQISQTSVTAVSYTHLDVYKRQM